MTAMSSTASNRISLIMRSVPMFTGPITASLVFMTPRPELGTHGSS